MSHSKVPLRHKVYAGYNPRKLQLYALAIAQKWRNSAPGRYAKINDIQQARAGNLVIWIDLYG